MSAKDAEKESTFLLSHQQLQRPQDDLYVFRVEGRDAERSIWVTSSEIPIAWYCFRICETWLGAVWETLVESLEGLIDPSKGVWWLG